MTDTAPAWPDPTRPGTPLNPERDGWHWLMFRDGSRLCCYWMAAQEAWASADKYQPDYHPHEAAEDHTGCEPCLTPAEVAAAVAEAVRHAEAERDELFNRLGRVTEELGLSVNCTAGRIIEAIRDRVAEEREACASVTVSVQVPDDAETWTPLEAWEEALLAADEAYRAAIRAGGAA